MSNLEARLDEVLEQLRQTQDRLRALEDEREISELLSRYGFMVDLPLEEEWLELFTEDGVMDAKFGNGAYTDTRWEGREAMRGFINDPAGRKRPSHYLKTMHLQGNNSVVRIDGDEAVATGYSLVVWRNDDGELRLNTGGSNEWKFRRVDGRWRIVQRSRREIGDPGAQEILTVALT